MGFVSFTRKYLSNSLVFHELNDNTADSDSLRKLQNVYLITTIEAEKSGFINVFTARLPKIRKHIMEVSIKERVEELFK